jgi:hypothetical protein
MLELARTVGPFRTIEGPPYHLWTLADGRPWAEFYRVADGFLVRFPDFADFFVSSDGERVVCRALPETTDPDIEHLFLNQVRPLALGLSGSLVFHASAVEIDGAAVCFVGASGRGKSTLAASFGLAGHRVLSDDALIVDYGPSAPTVRPSTPSLRLWPDSGGTLLGGQDVSVRNLSYTSKWRVAMGNKIKHCAEALPLRRAYFLGASDVDDVRIRPLGGADAVCAWISHAFVIDVDDMSAMKRHFYSLSLFTTGLECCVLDYPRHYERLAGVRSVIIRHVHERAVTHEA